MLSVKPVRGFRPLRSGDIEIDKVPKPAITIFLPYFNCSNNDLIKASTAFRASILVNPDSKVTTIIN